ncbi:MAG: hypothetical protein RQ723_03240 [Desulfuromonadales bacterium]|nr:hypothetical protein [Desulfuromonadales bacterium]
MRTPDLFCHELFQGRLLLLVFALSVLLLLGNSCAHPKQQSISPAPDAPAPTQTEAATGPPPQVILDQPSVPTDRAEGAPTGASPDPWRQTTTIPELIAQPDLPQALRPPGIPVPRPRQTEQPHQQDEALTRVIPESLVAKSPYQPKALLPEPAADPGIVYVVPFTTIMVPRQVENRLFDQFIEQLNTGGPKLELFFVILKEGLESVDPQWLSKRKYITGEIYAYVEEQGSTTTSLRARARIAYYRAHQQDPAFLFEYPAKTFFDRDRSTLEQERTKLADQVARALAEEILTALIP